MFPTQIENTQKISTMLTNLRKEHPQNGHIMSKEQLSQAMGKGRTWMSQVETGRLKKIKTADIIKIYEILLNVDPSTAQKEFLYFYDSYEEDSVKLKKLLDQFTSAVYDKYSSLSGTTERLQLFTFLNSLHLNLTQNFTDFEYLLDGLDLSILNQTSKWTRYAILDKITALKHEIDYTKKETLLKNLSREALSIPIFFNDDDGKFEGIKSCQRGVSLIYRLLDAIHEPSQQLEDDDLKTINFFIYAVNEYTDFYFPQFASPDLTKLSRVSFEDLRDNYTLLTKHIKFLRDQIPG